MDLIKNFFSKGIFKPNRLIGAGDQAPEGGQAGTAEQAEQQREEELTPEDVALMKEIYRAYDVTEFNKIRITTHDEELFREAYSTRRGKLDIPKIANQIREQKLTLRELKVFFYLMQDQDVDEIARLETLNEKQSGLLKLLLPRMHKKIDDERAVQQGAQEQQQAFLEEMDTRGEAKEYIDTFKTSPRLTVLIAVMDQGMQADPNAPLFNFQNWLTQPPAEVAAMFVDNGLFPVGRGMDEFLLGLREGPPDPVDKSDAAKKQLEKFDESNRVLREVVKVLDERFKMKRIMDADTAAQKERGPLGDTIGGGFKTLLKNFNRASGTEKALIVGAVGMAIHLIWKYKDSDFLPFSNLKVSEAARWIAAFWGVNYLVGKATPSGRTILQRVDLFRSVDDLKDDNVKKGFIDHEHFENDEETQKTLDQLESKDIKQLFQLYEEASAPARQKEIDPRKLGFYKNEINGRSAYMIMDRLVKQTSVNEHKRKLKAIAHARGSPPPGEPNNATKEEWRNSAIAQKAFEEKYLYGELGKIEQTLQDAIFNEYSVIPFQEDVARVNKERLAARVGAGTKAAAGAVGEAAGEAAEWARKTYEQDLKPFAIKAKDKVIVPAATATWKFLKEDVAISSYDYGRAKWAEYGPTLKKPFREAIAYLQERDLNKVLPPEFAIDVTESGKATIMGLPNVPFDITTRGGEEKIVFYENDPANKIEFKIADGIAGNQANAQRLADKIAADVTSKVRDYESNNHVSQLAGKNPRWDGVAQKWVVENVPVQGDSWLKLQPPANGATLEVKVKPDNSAVQFFVGGKEITDFAKLNEAYRNSVIQDKIWNDSRLLLDPADPTTNFLKGIPVDNINVTQDPTYGAIIEGRIGGLEFNAIPKQTPRGIHDGVEFYDPITGTTGGAELLEINLGNGGPDFVNNLSKKILEDPAYANEFLVLKAQMDNTSEGFLSRLSKAWTNRKLLFIPNPKAGMDGKILQNLWSTTVDFKMFETLEMFKRKLLGGTVKDVPTAYRQYIDSAVRQAKHLSAYLTTTLTDDEAKADEFDALMSGEPGRTTIIPNPAGGAPSNFTLPVGVEFINYDNKAYRDFFREFKRIITSDHYNYAGLDWSDLSHSEGYDVYLLALRAWNKATQKYASGELPPVAPDHLGTTAQAEINRSIQKITQKLDLAMQRGGGSIKKENLPDKGADTNAALDKWVQ